jgi:tyrosine-protein phosphatase MSG5
MSTCLVMEADSPTLKRSFDVVRDPSLDQYCDSRKRSDGEVVIVRSSGFACYRNSRPRPKRRSIPTSHLPAMPVQTSAPVPAAFPSFMSVFGDGMGNLQDDMREDTSLGDSRGGGQSNAEKTLQTHYPLPCAYQHHDNAASVNSDSTDSSPTTTVSTFGSPSMTDPSPSSSPESPISLVPLSSFHRMMASPKHGHNPTESSQRSMFFSSQLRSESPASKERNVKNLSLNMNIPSARPATSSGTEGVYAFSAPTSPLRGPLKTGRRKPNNLTIQTPGFDKTTFSACEIPPTPSYRPTLKHHESSPALPCLMSPTTAPLAGMHLPPIAMSRLLSRPGSESSFSSLSISSQGLQDLKEETAENDAPPKSQEAQERGYPDGPIRIYDSGVYLYLEPSAEEASKFDTVINVAKEVANPFSIPSIESKGSVMSVWRSSKNVDASEPQTAVSDMSFKSALEWPPVPAYTSPTTPKAASTLPEYFHVPWDHNSEILEDLYALCKIIDSRVSSSKSVLIHCQLGVSRSASLVIAYGLYKGFRTDFHSMYTSVKERSQWVGPNMSLIYQLMDFRTKVVNGEYAAASTPMSQDWFLNAGSENEMTPRPRPVPLDASIPTPLLSKPAEPAESTESAEPAEPAEPLAKCSPPIDLGSSVVPILPFGDDQRATRKDSLPTALSNIVLSSPGAESVADPSSTSSSRDAPPIPPKSARRIAPPPLSLRERSHPLTQTFEIPPHTPRDKSQSTISTQTVSYRPVKMDLMMMQDLPPTPSIFSPRTTEFRVTSLNGTNAGDLATLKSGKRPAHAKRMSVFAPITQAPLAVDPRSPHHGDENARIMRYIDDVL